jgi:heme/copper-type cytochrome/quinol oxidase subunit 2
MNREIRPSGARRPFAQASTVLLCLIFLWFGCCGGGLLLPGSGPPWADSVAAGLTIAGVAAFVALVITLIVFSVLTAVRRTRE